MKLNFLNNSKIEEKRRKIRTNNPEYNKSFNYARLANAYFLILLILQLIPQISSLNPITTILPLSCVLILKALKDLIDDIARHRNDNLVNSRPTYVLRDGKLRKENWCSICVGDIIRISNDDFVAADLLLLSSSEPHGLCYIETAELDGETNLKVKQAITETSQLNDDVHALSAFDAYIECEAPNERLNQFEGTLTWNECKYPLDNDKMLLRGCRLRNTRWSFGLVVFAGSDSKLMKNGGKTKFKQTHIDHLLNYLIFGIVMFLLTMCGVCTVACGVWEFVNGYNFQVFLPWESFIPSNRILGSLSISALVFLSYLIILNTVVPISLYVSVEFIRSIQSLWINWDIQMYYEKNDTPAKARTTTLNEELGQIEYIFSDKTGTLTQNIMTFNKCSINGHLYGYIYNGLGNEEKINDGTLPIDFSSNPYFEPSFRFYDKSLLEAIHAGNEDCHRFFTLLCVCHTVMAEEKKNMLTYQAQSPDEGALVSAARNFGFVFKSRTPNTITIEIQGKQHTYDVLNILDFNNVRKRMSVILRVNGRIVLFCKGADSVIQERLDVRSLQKWSTTEEHLNKFANEALRTLCLAWKEIPDDVYNEWKLKCNEVSCSFEDRAEKVSQCYDEIEKNLILVGSTAIEDKLQDGVPECIEKLSKANIKIWVLTGDKQETAINIGISCKLLNDDMDEITLEGHTIEDVYRELCSLEMKINELKKRIDRFHEESFRKLDEPSLKKSDESVPNDGYALIVNGQTLVYVLGTSNEEKFVNVACACKAVICCRVTPGQKKGVVDLVKQHRKAITLAIGDGANDVSMIKSAHIGVGISGQEGQQAVLASDFSIGQFRFLERLLLVHGRWSYYRISKFLRYFFYKNFASTLCHFWFAFYCGFSAQTLFDPFFISTYNVFFSSLPVLALGVFDQDVNDKMSVDYPKLYLPGQKGTLFNRKEFMFSVLHGCASSLVLFYIPYGCMFGSVRPDGRDAADLQSFGFAVATILVIVVNLQCGLETSYWTGFNHFCIWGTLAVHFLFHFALYSQLIYRIFGMGWYYIGTAEAVCSTAIFWFTVLLTSCVLLLPVIAYRFVKLDLNPTLSDMVRIKQKYGSKSRSRSTFFATRPRSSIRASNRSFRRSGYAFSHEEGFGELIRLGKMMPSAKNMIPSVSKSKFLKSRKDLLDVELADNADRNSNVRLTKLVLNKPQ